MSPASSSQIQIESPVSKEEPKAEDGGLTLPRDIPGEIWTEIGKRLVSRLDVSRFRSVCRTWRRRLPPPLRFPLRVPSPPGHRGPALSHYIAESTFYAVGSEMIVLFEEDRRGGGFSASALVKRFQFPTTNKFELPPVSEIPNLSFLCNAYHLHKGVPITYTPPKEPGVAFVANCAVLKIAIIQSLGTTFNPNYPRLRDLKVVAHLLDTRKLAVLSLGGGAMNNTWETPANTASSSFEDIVNYRGQLHAVDRTGRAFVMDYTSFHMTQVAAALPPDSEIFLRCKRRNWKVMHLSVVSGDLYMFINEPDHLFTPRLYKLSSGLGQWVEADQHFPPDQVFVQDLQCNFPVPKTLFTTRCDPTDDNCRWQSEVPRFCSFPGFEYIRCAVGFKNEYHLRRYLPHFSYRYCDNPSLAYYTR